MNINENINEEVHFEYQNKQWTMERVCLVAVANLSIMGRASFSGEHLTQLDHQKPLAQLFILPFIQSIDPLIQWETIDPNTDSVGPAKTAHTCFYSLGKPLILTLVIPGKKVPKKPLKHLYQVGELERDEIYSRISTSLFFLRHCLPFCFSHLKCVKSDWMSRLIFPSHPKFILFEALLLLRDKIKLHKRALFPNFSSNFLDI